jgi:hypothetical protein
VLIGTIHLLFGIWLLSTETTLLHASIAYDIYTSVFDALVLVFAVLIWMGKLVGWAGTVAVSVFVSVADALVLLDLPSIPGIPVFAASTEIAYSILVIAYLSLRQVRKKV